MPNAVAEVASDLSIAFLVLLERLAPEERAAFLLHEVFDTGYPEIAEVLGKSEAACRQLVHRARERVRTERARFSVAPDAKERLLGRFIAALEADDQAALLALFAEDASLTSDSGGKTPAAINMLAGPMRIARFFLGVARKRRRGGYEPVHRMGRVNGEPAVLTYLDGALYATTAIATDGERILAMYRTSNPDKLRHSEQRADAKPNRVD